VNTWQASQRVKNVLKSLRWGGTGDAIFGRDSVFVTQGSIMQFIDQLKLGDAAGAFVKVGTARAHAELKDLWIQNLSVFLMVAVPGDQIGERPLIGANRSAITGGGGRGLLEVEVEALAAIEQLDRSGQFAISFRVASKAEPFQNEDGYHLAREYAFEAELSRAYQYMAPLAVAASGDPTVTISWTAPDIVTNLVAYVVRRVSGTIPAGFVTDGTDVPWTSGTSTTDAPGSGTFTYSVFAAYDDEGGAVEQDHSDYDSDFATVA
jgi:hypothetical protein